MDAATEVFDTAPAINYRTTGAKLRADVLIEKLDHYKRDTKKAQRLERHECKTCYYLLGDRIFGQAFTPYPCGVCHETNSWANTGVPKVCLGCANKLRLCVRCGADINMRKRKETT